MHSSLKSLFKTSRTEVNDFYTCLINCELGTRLVPREYASGAQLCMEGQSADGVFSICGGQAKEYFTSARGKTAIIRFLSPGDVVGLEAVFGGFTYATTVEAIEPAKTIFIATRDLLNSMRSDQDLRMAVARELSDRCKCAYQDIRQFGPAVPARVAQFLLDRQRGNAEPDDDNEAQMLINFTREEIAQKIGSTRETVSRIVTFFRRKKWIHVEGARWKIHNRARLAELVAR